MSVTEPRALRADALRNRERVVVAAAAVFGERGIDASVPEVAERAGVGKATVYRSFPTKEHLIAAVVIERLEDFERGALAARDDPDPWAALVERLMDRAKAQGRMHPSAQPADLRVLWAGVARMLVADGIEDPAVWRHYAELVANALRADGVAAIGFGGRSASARARSSTASSIAGVRRPVNVFCWLG